MDYWVGQKFVCFFPYGGSSSASLSLTSFETTLLDCIATAVISVCIKKHLSKLVNFCVAILIWKMEENKQHFWHVMLYYFKNDKNTTETHQNRCVQCVEKVL